MPRCLDCRCVLPGFDTLCSNCLEARYSRLDNPKTILESAWQYVLNPLGLKDERLRSGSAMTPQLALIIAGIGLAVCWFGGFAKLGYQDSLFSGEVFSEAFEVAVKSALWALALSLYATRKNLRLYWEAALFIFVTSSILYARWCWHVGVFHRYYLAH
jgi:hypothetical protein